MVSRSSGAAAADEPIDRAAALKMFAALSQASRLAVFLQIAAAGPEGVAAQSVADALHTTGSALTLHLRALEAAGLVQVQIRRRGLQHPVVTARVERWIELTAWLAEHWRGPARIPGAPRTEPPGRHGGQAASGK